MAYPELTEYSPGSRAENRRLKKLTMMDLEIIDH